jgi:hypothetical protein
MTRPTTNPIHLAISAMLPPMSRGSGTCRAPAKSVRGHQLATAALVSLAMPGVVATEWLIVLFGVLLFVTPSVLT